MKLIIESRDELLVLQSVYEGYKLDKTSHIDKYWEVCETNDEGHATKIIIDFDIPGVGCEYRNREVMSLISFELLRIKHLQYVRKNKHRISELNVLVGSSNFGEEDIDVKIVFDVFLNGIKTSYYTSLMTIALHEFISNDRDYIDLSAFAKFNTKGYDEDFDLTILDALAAKKEGSLDRSEAWLHDLLGDVAGNYEEMTGSPFEIMEQIKELWDLNNREHENRDKVFLKVTKNGEYIVSDGANEITKDLVQDEIGFNYETEENGQDFDVEFEDAMMLILYCIIFLKTNKIYVVDEYLGDSDLLISEYLEILGIYPKYNPYIIMQNKEE